MAIFTLSFTPKTALLSLYAITLIVLANFSIIAQPQTILLENFDACALPIGWQNTAVTGNATWLLGQDSDNWTTSMNNSCMAYFNDDELGNTAPISRVQLLSPPFDGTQNAQITFEVDFNFRSYNSSKLIFMVFDGENYRTLITYTGQNYTGDAYSNYAHASIDISAYRATNNRIAIIYDDGGAWAWWAAIDNFKITGEGSMNDDCSRAVALNLNIPCDTTYSNINAIFTGEASNCVETTEAGVWFSFQAPLSGMANIVTETADFNEVLSVFSGNSCANLTQIACGNYDEFGFIGETLRLNNLVGGQTYYIRLSGRTNSFGKSEGNFCIEVQQPDAPPTPAPLNDLCTNAVALQIDSPCTQGTNRGATLSPNEPLPSKNERSRASVWYSFVAPSTGNVLIENDADFADVLTVYSGNDCGQLSEIDGNDYGRTLQLSNLIANATYYLQISGYFATIEGDFCVRIKNVTPAPANEICTQAIPLTLNDNCVAANNQNARFTGDLVDLIVPFDSYTSNNETGISYTRPNQGSNCQMSTTVAQYDVFTFIVDSSANYTILNTYSQNYDGYLHIYSNSFDPQNPCATYLAGNDDFNGTGFSNVNVALNAGTTYYIVTSAWQSSDLGEYTTTITGPGNAVRMQYGANINGMPSTCDYQPDAPIWFSFVAPASGKVRIATHTDFPHILSLYAGACGSLAELSCYFNPSRCEDAPLFSNLIAGETYFIQIASAHTPFGYSYGEVCVRVKEVAADPIRVKVKAFLEGAYLGNGNMRSTLSQSHLLSEQQPYNTAPWFYEGEECAEIMPNNIVDWIIVELRDPNDMNTVIAQKAALLNNTGNINDRDKDGIYFDVSAGDYYIALRHRNHLAVMSSVPVPLPNINNYNFAVGDNYAFGSNQLKNMGDGNFALYAGDTNSNGVITVADFNIFMEQMALINVYLSGDVNLDRVVSVDDFNKYQPNASQMCITPLRY
jgi:hypothetical protein